MSPSGPPRNSVGVPAWPHAQLITLTGVMVAVFITGREDVWALLAVLAGAGIGMLLGQPTARPGWIPTAVGLGLCALGATALLPQAWFDIPAWRSLFPPDGLVPLANSVSPQPAMTLFWLTILAATVVTALFLLSSPIKGIHLLIFLQVVTVLIAVYGAMAIAAYQTGWSYPFASAAVFGFFPNKNHTATLLAVGAILSCGLIHHAVLKKRVMSAVLAALTVAVPLAGLLFFSNSRAGLLLLVVGLTLWLIGVAHSLPKKATLTTAGIVAVFLAGLFLSGSNPVRDRVEDLLRRAVEVEAADGLGELDFRQVIMRDTLRLLSDYQVTGVGLGQFQYVFPHYRNESVRAATILHPESDWIMVAAEMGLPAAGLLLVLAGYYFMRNWRARRDDDGPLRWAVAAAVGAALLHGLIDVPWHRPALGWLLLVIAMAAMPGGEALKRLRGMRIIYALCGLALLGLTWTIAIEFMKGTAPAPYNWPLLNQRLTLLGEQKRQEEGEFLSLEAIRAFPLKYESYYWLASYLRAFRDTEKEVLEAMKAGRAVEPVLPNVAADQAMQWRELRSVHEVEAWAEAVRRCVRIDGVQKDGRLGSAKGMIDRAQQSLRDNDQAELEFSEQIGSEPLLLSYWFYAASPGAGEAWLQKRGDVDAWLDVLPEEMRGRVLDRWVVLPSAAGAVGYMEARGGAAVYGRQLANHYAKEGDKERAVRMLAGAEGVSLEGRTMGGEFGGQLAGLEAQRNEVAVRRLLKEAVDAKEANRERLSVAVSWFAAAGDWEMAWRAASRLASTRKSGQ